MKVSSALLCFLVCTASSAADSRALDGHGADTRSTVNFPGFLREAADALTLRRTRLVDIDEFNAMAAENGTVILDTRSRDAFERRHLRGALHLSLSDMTEETLTRTLGSRDRRILIYCNNNFLNDPEAFARKTPAAALNIPTYATLYIYDYRNVFELGSLLDVTDPRLSFEGTGPSMAQR